MKIRLDALGGWPVVEGKNWRENIWAWQRVLLELEMKGFGSNHLFDSSIEVDMKNSSRRLIYVNIEDKRNNFYVDIGRGCLHV